MDAWISEQSGGIQGAVSSLLTSLRETNLPSLGSVQSNVLAHLTSMSPNDKHAPVFDHVLLYVIEQFDRFAVGQRRAGLIGSFCSESDLATAYEALLPFLDNEVVDTVAISRAGFRPPAVLEVRLLLERDAKCPAFLAAAGMDGWINRQSGAIVSVIDSLFDSIRATHLLPLTPFMPEC
jgi:hypothetical protein